MFACFEWIQMISSQKKDIPGLFSGFGNILHLI